MNNFLTRLVMRNTIGTESGFGNGALVKPRLGSRFEARTEFSTGDSNWNEIVEEALTSARSGPDSPAKGKQFSPRRDKTHIAAPGVGDDAEQFQSAVDEDLTHHEGNVPMAEATTRSEFHHPSAEVETALRTQRELRPGSDGNDTPRPIVKKTLPFTPTAETLVSSRIVKSSAIIEAKTERLADPSGDQERFDEHTQITQRRGTTSLAAISMAVKQTSAGQQENSSADRSWLDKDTHTHTSGDPSASLLSSQAELHPAPFRNGNEREVIGSGDVALPAQSAPVRNEKHGGEQGKDQTSTSPASPGNKIRTGVQVKLHSRHEYGTASVDPALEQNGLHTKHAAVATEVKLPAIPQTGAAPAYSATAPGKEYSKLEPAVEEQTAAIVPPASGTRQSRRGDEFKRHASDTLINDQRTELSSSSRQEKENTAVPAINVSIGRIEIRAATPPPAPPAPVPRARRGPAVSLDDYLKKSKERR